MKNIVLVLTIMLFVTACTDLLEETPKAVAMETFYNTADEINAAVYAAYFPLWEAITSVYEVDNTEVDYAVGRVSFAPYSDFQGALVTDTRIPNSWTGWYKVIRNANLVIKNAPKSTKATQQQIEQFVGEAKFLRAYSYFVMVRNWGALPIRTEENMIKTDVPRSPENDVYELILSDLKYAEANLPESQTLAGRADKYAAKTLLADVYLQLGQWSDSRTKALEVINSGKYSLIKVSTPDDFYKIFGSDVVRSSEEIFYEKASLDVPNEIARFRAHSSVPYCNYTGVFAKYTDSVTNKVISDWDYKDLRKKFILYNCNIGFGPTTMLFKKYIDTDAINAKGTNDWPAYRYTDILLVYAEADCRVNNGPTTDGMEKLNMIHRRAYGMDPDVASAIDFNVADYTKDTFIDLVLKEGLYEQMDEGKRFFALKRTGKIKEAVKYARGIDVVDKHLLWPIPSVEYLYNKAIDPTTDQNPGY
jgi:starch-binding outer membrane protein, SusD/RagB family